MRHFITILITFMCFAAAGCAHHFTIPDNSTVGTYTLEADNSRLARFAPVFVVYDHDAPFNRIGRPEARIDSRGSEEIRVAPAPAVFYMAQRPFKTGKNDYTNLIYRIHFPETPYRLMPFNLTAGKNVGLMVVVTLDRQERPVLITTVHTCGCYMAITPTDHLDHQPTLRAGSMSRWMSTARCCRAGSHSAVSTSRG